MDEREDKGFRFPSTTHQQRRNVENKEDMKSFSAFLLDMLPQSAFHMRCLKHMAKRLFKKADPNDCELKESVHFFVRLFKMYKPNLEAENDEIAFGLKVLLDLAHTNFECYQRVPYLHVEQGIHYLLRKNLCSHPVLKDASDYIQVKLLGSLADGLSYPFVQKTLLVMIDFDVMIVLNPPFFPKVTSHMLIDGSGCHPGYVKLKVMGKHWIFEKPGVLETDHEDIYLSNKCMHILLHVEESESTNIPEGDINYNTFSNGPALSFEATMCEKGSLGLTASCDIVVSFSWHDWPNEATEWLSRKRLSGWPNRKQINTVKELGCYFVPVPNPGDKDCRTEWRISFVEGERYLALSFTQVQRYVYRIIKLIHKHRLAELGVLSTYHLKTTLFWLCERIPQEKWTDEEMGQRFYDFFDLLLDFLSSKCIPNYFIRENNMIDYMDEQLVNESVDILNKIRHNPKAILHVIQATYDLDPDFIHCVLTESKIREELQDIQRLLERDSPDEFGAILGGVMCDILAESLSKHDSVDLNGAIGGAKDDFSKNGSDYDSMELKEAASIKPFVLNEYEFEGAEKGTSTGIVVLYKRCDDQHNPAAIILSDVPDRKCDHDSSSEESLATPCSLVPSKRFSYKIFDSTYDGCKEEQETIQKEAFAPDDGDGTGIIVLYKRCDERHYEAPRISDSRDAPSREKLATTETEPDGKH